MLNCLRVLNVGNRGHAWTTVILEHSAMSCRLPRTGGCKSPIAFARDVQDWPGSDVDGGRSAFRITLRPLRNNQMRRAGYSIGEVRNQFPLLRIPSTMLVCSGILPLDLRHCTFMKY